MDDSDAVLAANLEFYRAFTTRDAEAMDALWARRAPVACVHPGWPPLADREAVIESWRGILSNAESPRIVCYDERVFLYGETALVILRRGDRRGPPSVASNWFVREDGAPGAWQHHHAGQIVARRAAARAATRRRDG